MPLPQAPPKKVPSKREAPPEEAEPESSSSSGEDSLLHDACRLYPKTLTVIMGALRVDPSNIRRRGASSQVDSSRMTKRPRSECFEYPVNIALDRDASLDVLQLLVQAGPEVLRAQDGPELCCTLSLALNKKRDEDIVRMIVEANPDCLKVTDRYANLPLHIACATGASLAVVKLLCMLYPAGIDQKNLHGQKPLEIAQRNALCSDAIVDHLQQKSFGWLEDEAEHL